MSLNKNVKSSATSLFANWRPASQRWNSLAAILYTDVIDGCDSQIIKSHHTWWFCIWLELSNHSTPFIRTKFKQAQSQTTSHGANHSGDQTYDPSWVNRRKLETVRRRHSSRTAAGPRYLAILTIQSSAGAKGETYDYTIATVTSLMGDHDFAKI